jgi:quinol monooxygenase YgiN
MSLIAIIGQFDVHPEDATAVADLMRTMMNQTQKEQGCLHYAFAADISTPNRFQLSELWEDDEALAAHFRTAHMTAFRAGLAQLRIHRRMVRRYNASNPVDL